MDTNRNHRSDLEDWTNIWDDMNKEGMVPPPEPLKPPQMSPFAAHMLGQYEREAQDAYYDVLEDELLSEMKSPNPIYPDSVGPDPELPKPVWVEEDFVKEISSLKDKLFALENRMAKMGQSEKWSEKPIFDDGKKLMEEIRKLRDQIEKVSSQLGIKDEPSPWEIKRD